MKQANIVKNRTHPKNVKLNLRVFRVKTYGEMKVKIKIKSAEFISGYFFTSKNDKINFC